MKESKTTFAYIVEHMTEPSFEKVRNISCDFVQKLSSDLVDGLYDQLNRGVELLDSEPLLQMYFYSYGQMHAEKLMYAFKQLSPYIKSAEKIEIVDYGCGQGLATMCYHDFIKDYNFQQQVHSITLIEPSALALSRAELLCNCFFPEATITAIHKGFDELLEDEIRIDADCPTLHLFSNILDVESYDIAPLADKIKASCQGDNEFVIVSPMQNARRIGRLTEFVDFLGTNCYFRKCLDKQQLREDKDWTCCAILCSTRNREFAAINVKDIHQKVKNFFNDVTLWYDKESTKAFLYEVRICAENGDAECMNVMGLFYRKGIFLEKNIKEAFTWFKLAAEYGFPEANRNLALMYARGHGVDKNISLSIEIIDRIKDCSAPLYYLSLGEIEKIAGNPEAACENFRSAAKLGNTWAKYFYGTNLLKGKYCEKNIKSAIKYIRSAARNSIAPACLLLARFYEKGFSEGGIEQSNTLAVKNYKYAAKNGNVRAQKRLAEIYKNGILGVSKNPKESFKWYLIAAENGDLEDAFYIAFSYANGNGIDINYVEAVKWYKIAADKGSSAAMNNLAICYENGHGVEKDEIKAFSLYLRSAEAGSITAANNVSACYQKGTGVKINPQQALFWKEKAAEGGKSFAQGKLAEWYFKGYGTTRNYEKALFWYIKSKLNKEENCISIENTFDFITHKANDGNVLFQYLLAKCYDYGVFVPKDHPLSIMWYEKSAANGFVESVIKLRCIDSISTEVTNEEKAKGVKDNYGVLYSQDGKKVLSSSYVHCKFYAIRRGTRIICDGAFGNQCIKQLLIPSSVVAIGHNPFASDPYYHDNKIAIKNQSPHYIVKGDALYTKDGSTIVAYWGNRKQFIIPDHVIHVANGCFSNSKNLETIIFPQGIESIGCKAFEDCYSLKSLDLPKSVKYIGESAFWGCEALEAIWSLGSIKTIESKTFEGCNLKNVHLPSCLVSIMDNAFNSNGELRIIDFPDMLETIGNYAFAYCYKLEHINLGDSIKFIGDFCFYHCAIKEVRLPSSLIYLGIRPFDKVKNIITRHEGQYKAEMGMLINRKTKNLECYYGDCLSITLKGIKSISPLAFYESNIEEVILCEDITSLPEYAFYNSQNLSNIELSEKLKFIGEGAFYGCSRLCNISIPKSVQEVNRAAFSRCISLERIELKGVSINISESIIAYNDFEALPTGYLSKYHSHNIPMGSTTDELIIVDSNYKQDEELFEESLKCITIVVPKSAKSKYTFKTVHQIEWNQHEMDRRFKIIENDGDR